MSVIKKEIVTYVCDLCGRECDRGTLVVEANMRHPTVFLVTREIQYVDRSKLDTCETCQEKLRKFIYNLQEEARQCRDANAVQEDQG